MTLPVRKQNRLKGYHYNTMGAYFITICVQNRYTILSEIMSEKNTVGDGFPVPHTDISDKAHIPVGIKLSTAGQIAEKYINNITEKYQNAFVDQYVIMPDHVHLLLTLTTHGTGNPSPTIGNIIGWFKYQTTKEINVLFESLGQRIWQRSYYDHVVRDEEDYWNIYQYIEENPVRWLQR